MPWQAPDVVPTLVYDDAPAAIDFLERAFGFERHAVHADGDTVHHAELRFGSGMVMLGSVREEGPFDARPPRSGGAAPMGAYVIVADTDAHHERATAAGAQVVAELHDTDYGSRDYSATDPEGYLWHFGTYRPEAD